MNMKTIITQYLLWAIVFATFLVASCSPQNSEEMSEGEASSENEVESIFPQGKKGPAKNFTDNAYNYGLVSMDSIYTMVMGNVYFEPAARTAWHTHPAAQTLIITAGLGWVQREGAPIEEVRPGDVVWFSPNEKHWHGASPHKVMSHIAIQEEVDGEVVVWMDKVLDDQYATDMSTLE